MVTVETFVENHLVSPVKILFITENCPNYGNYFYRTLPGNPHLIGGPNHNLLNNLCIATGIMAANENDKLNIFLNNRKYAVIDTYVNGVLWELTPPHHNIPDICEDIISLNPEQIVFTSIRSNKRLFAPIVAGLPPHLRTRIIIRSDGGNVFNSPCDWAFTGFLNQINSVIAAGTLVL
jgi:hypothetical protein